MILVNNQLDVEFVQVTVWYAGHLLNRRSPARGDINHVSLWYNNVPGDGHMAARNM